MGASSERAKRDRRKESRLPYEFTNEVRAEIRERSGGYCEECEVRRGQQYHHVISVSSAIMYGYPPEKIASPDNGMYVCEICHEGLDRDA